MVTLNNVVKKTLYWVLIILASFFLIILVIHLLTANKPVVGNVEKGNIDLKGSLCDDNVIFLSGDWEFYSDVLLKPGEKQENTVSYLKVPGSWSENDAFPIFGIGTYRLHVDGLQPNRIYGFYIINPSTAYHLIINGQSVMKKGVVSGDLQEYQPETVPDIALFYSHTSSLEVIIHMANYTRNYSGLTRAVSLGTEKALYAYRDKLLFRDVLYLGAILVMALYHLILFGIKKDKAALYFSLFCCLIAVDSALSNTQLAFQVFPGLSFTTGVRIAYLSDTFMLPLFILYIKSLFPMDTPNVLRTISISAAIVQAILLLVLPVYAFLEYYIFYYSFIVLIGIFMLIIIIRASKQKRTGAWIILIGAGVVFVSALNDILHARLIVQSGYFLNVGFFVFIILQAVLIALRYSWAMKEVETLTLTLENRVKERTEELQQEKDQLEAISRMDDMTHIYNKRYIMEKLSAELKNYKQCRHTFSIAMIDIDYFKEVNDRFGHIIGDRVIEQIAGMISENTRKTDICGRFGGEEFMIIMRETSLKGAYAVAEKIREIISDSRIETEKGTISLKASFGLAEVNSTIQDPDELIYYADKALYHAKDSGRNRVECFVPSLS